VTTQAQIVRQMIALNRAHHDRQAIVMVTHNLGVAAYMSDVIVVMQAGRIVETGTRDAILHRPADPYTKQLLAAVPTMAEGRMPR
jgi:peptide/nickel transport system ATP-binding protein